MEVMVSEGYTLWLMPSGEEYNRFTKLIKKLAQQYHAPVFQPHITLLGEFPQPEEEAIKLTQELVTNQKPFPISLGEIDYQDYHFRALFVRADKTPDLVNLHERTKKLFGMEHIPPYMPHLSLLYGNYPVKLKKKIINEIGNRQPAYFEISSVFLKKGGEVKNWKTVGEFPFQKLNAYSDVGG